MTRLHCNGADCKAWVDKDEAHQNGWTIVLMYPLREGDGESRRRLLCRICSRKHWFIFRG